MGNAVVATPLTGNGYTVFGNRRITIGTMTLSSNYATGGDTCTAAQLGLVHITALEFVGTMQNSSNTAQGYIYSVNVVTTGATANQIATIQAFGDGGNAPGAPLIEAAPGTNLTTYSCEFIAYGY